MKSRVCPSENRLGLVRGLGIAIAVSLFVVKISPIGAAEPVASPRETVLFPFDDHGLPFSKGLVLTLVPGRKSAINPGLGIDPEHPGKPVLPIGKPGDPDFPRAYFFGTVLRVEGEYRMWYSGHDGHRRQVCYAVSKDGVKWAKPKLGLVDYNGSKENNLVEIDGGQAMQGMSALVVHDPEDANPQRRFKMIREINSAQLLAAVSADGLHWNSAAGNQDVIQGSNIEPSGFIKHDGVFYLNGHGGPVPHPIPTRGLLRPQKRMMVTLVSYDFEHWADVGHVSFRRDHVPPRPPLDFEFHRGEQVHLGAGLWDRGNVIVGFYGQYHNETNDRRTSYCDLGLIVSPDAVHFHEPVPDFKIVPSFEEEDRAEPRLTQAQGFANAGNRTFVYYGIWTENDRNSPTGVRIATWPRDRLGYFSPASGIENAHCVSSPIRSVRDGTRVFVNATGLSELGQLQIEILDEEFRPLAGFSAAECLPFQHDSGLRLGVGWRGKDALPAMDRPIRIGIRWSGKHSEATRLYALYLETASPRTTRE